jgi:hypothetical protein
MDGGIRSNAPRDGVTTRLDPAYRRAESEFGQPLTSLKGIKTKSLFSLMDLPAELRLKVRIANINFKESRGCLSGLWIIVLILPRYILIFSHAMETSL